MPMRPALRIPGPVLFFAAAALVCAPALPGFSVPPEEEGFASPSPQARARAVGMAVAEEDRAAIPHLITMLGSDDPAHRMLAIRALEHLTGETFGYSHTAPEAAREEAIANWAEWWRGAREQPDGARSLAPAASMADYQSPGGAHGPSAGARPADQER